MNSDSDLLVNELGWMSRPDRFAFISDFVLNSYDALSAHRKLSSDWKLWKSSLVRFQQYLSLSIFEGGCGMDHSILERCLSIIGERGWRTGGLNSGQSTP